MNDLQKHFLADSTENLVALRKSLGQDFSERRRREAFRLVHTIKGTAQAFALSGTATIAHELENLLAQGEIAGDENLQSLLLEGFDQLIDSLRQPEGERSGAFLDKLKARTSVSRSDILLTQIPPDVFRKFSETEKNAALVALRQKKHILCAEIGFERHDFADRYRNLRKSLSERGTVIAALPSRKFIDLGKIGFQIFLASELTAAELQQAIENFSPEIISHTCADDASPENYEMFSNLTTHGENLARELDKEVAITVVASETRMSPETTKIVFELLLHLVRNAIDHAIERSGKLEIRFLAENEELYLSVADDGKGVDLEAVRARAIAKRLISGENELNDQTLLELIFAPEISTAREVSEISGRGVGLEAVKSLVEKIGGKISVRSRKSMGTIFEIVLPTGKL